MGEPLYMRGRTQEFVRFLSRQAKQVIFYGLTAACPIGEALCRICCTRRRRWAKRPRQAGKSGVFGMTSIYTCYRLDVHPKMSHEEHSSVSPHLEKKYASLRQSLAASVFISGGSVLDAPS